MRSRGQMSGLKRESSVSPRLEKSMMSRTSFDPESGTAQPRDPPIGRTLSDAPTLITFFAVPGVPTVFVPGPRVACTANTSASSWPVTMAGHGVTHKCVVLLRVRVVRAALSAPQELLETRAPFA